MCRQFVLIGWQIYVTSCEVLGFMHACRQQQTSIIMIISTHRHIPVTLYPVSVDPFWASSYVSIEEEDIGENEHTKGESSGT